MVFCTILVDLKHCENYILCLLDDKCFAYWRPTLYTPQSKTNNFQIILSVRGHQGGPIQVWAYVEHLDSTAAFLKGPERVYWWSTVCGGTDVIH